MARVGSASEFLIMCRESAVENETRALAVRRVAPLPNLDLDELKEG